MKYEYKLVEICWLDAETSHGWEEIEATDLDPIPAVTVGFLLAQNEYYLSVASTYSEGSCNSRIKIPVSMVQTMTELKTVRTKKGSLLALKEQPKQLGLALEPTQVAAVPNNKSGSVAKNPI